MFAPGGIRGGCAEVEGVVEDVEGPASPGTSMLPKSMNGMGPAPGRGKCSSITFRFFKSDVLLIYGYGK
jgi:hypothetical protein